METIRATIPLTVGNFIIWAVTIVDTLRQELIPACKRVFSRRKRPKKPTYEKIGAVEIFKESVSLFQYALIHIVIVAIPFSIIFGSLYGVWVLATKLFLAIL